MKKTLFVNAKIFTSDESNLYADSMVIENDKILWVGRFCDLPDEYKAEFAADDSANKSANNSANDSSNSSANNSANNSTNDSESNNGSIAFSDAAAIVDMGGKTVIPGLIDCHMHPVMLADYAKQIAVLPPRIHSIKELQDAIREEAGKFRENLCQSHDLPWIQGWGYDEGKLEEGRSPNRWDLDAACSDLPISLIRSCAHIRVVNSKALEIAGITRDTKDPEGGQIDRDENGEPTGILRENARYIIDEFIPVLSTEEKADNLMELGRHLASQGIVAFCDLGALDGIDNYPIFARALEKGLSQDISMYYIWDFIRGWNNRESLHWQDDGTNPASQPGSTNPASQPGGTNPAPQPGSTENSGFDTTRLRVSGLKLISDGSVSGRTAWMEEPYLSESGETESCSAGENEAGCQGLKEPLTEAKAQNGKTVQTETKNASETGISTLSDELLDEAIEFAKKKKLQLAVHAMGGRAISRLIGRLAAEKKWTEGSMPHVRLEHLTEPGEEAMVKAAENGMAFVTQPIFLYCEIESYLKNLGLERAKKCYPINRMLEHGIDVALSTDSPATSWADPSDPFVNIGAACTRRAFDGTDVDVACIESGAANQDGKVAGLKCENRTQKLDVETAVLLYTKAPAKIAGFDNLGMLKAGCDASFVVLSDDIFSVPAEKISGLKAEETYIRGKRV